MDATAISMKGQHRCQHCTWRMGCFLCACANFVGGFLVSFKKKAINSILDFKETILVSFNFYSKNG